MSGGRRAGVPGTPNVHISKGPPHCAGHFEHTFVGRLYKTFYPPPPGGSHPSSQTGGGGGWRGKIRGQKTAYNKQYFRRLWRQIWANLVRTGGGGGVTVFGGAFPHSAGTAPITTVLIPGTPLQTTPLQKRARSIQNRIEGADIRALGPVATGGGTQPTSRTARSAPPRRAPLPPPSSAHTPAPARGR